MYLITDHKIHQVKAGNIVEEHWEEEREGNLTHCNNKTTRSNRHTQNTLSESKNLFLSACGTFFMTGTC